MSTWWFLTWTGPEIKEKVVNLPGVEHLYDIMDPKEIIIPSFVMEYDRKVSRPPFYSVYMYMLPFYSVCTRIIYIVDYTVATSE